MRRVLVALVLLQACRKPAASPAPPAADAAPPPSEAPKSLPEVVSIESMAIEAGVWPPAGGNRPDERALAGRIWEVLSQSAMFEDPRRRVSGARHPVRRARLRAAYGVDVVGGDQREAGGRVMRAAVTMTLEWQGTEDVDLYENVACDAKLARGEAFGGMPTRLVECAIQRGAQGLIEKEAVRRGDQSTVLAALDSPDPSLRAVSLAVIAERRLGEAVPKLLEMLGSPDVLVRDGAIGALVALREPRAIKPLTDLAPFKDLDMMRRIIDAVGAIGGDDARAYLELVASGHDVPAVRELASQALDRLDRHAGRDAAP